MRKIKVWQRVAAILVALFLLLSLIPGAVFMTGRAAVSLGMSYTDVSDAAALKAALSSNEVGTIYLSADIDASDAAENYFAFQVGDKKITSRDGTKTLVLPQALDMKAALQFENISLGGGGSIYANGKSLHILGGVGTTGALNLFGGGLSASDSFDIQLQSGSFGEVHAAGNGAAVIGGGSISVSGSARVGTVHAGDTGQVGGSVNITMDSPAEVGSVVSSDGRRYLTARYYTDKDLGTLPSISGLTSVRLENSSLHMTSWPAALDAGSLTLSSSVLKLDGQFPSMPVPLIGENATILVTGGSTVTLPNMLGRFELDLETGVGGDAAIITNAANYAGVLSLAAGLSLSGSGELAIASPTVNDPAVQLEIVQAPKNNYTMGEALDVTNGLLRVTYQSGAQVQAAMAATMVTGFDSSRPGPLDLIVTHEGLTATYRAWVADPSITRREIAKPNKTSYYRNEIFAPAGGLVILTYANGTVANIPFTDPSVYFEGFETTFVGTKTVSVYHNAVFCGSFTVTVSAKSSGGGSSSDKSYGGTMLADGDRNVKLLGVPKNNTVKVGDTFTLTPTPNNRGSWDWDRDFFKGSVNENTRVATFTALKAGNSRIVYRDSFASKTETLFMQIEPAASGPSSGSSVNNPNMGGDTIPPAAVSPVRPEIPSVQDLEPAPAVVEEDDTEDPEPEPVAEELLPEIEEVVPDLEEIVATVDPARLRIALIGAAAAVLLMVAGGVGIWRTCRKT